MSLRHGPEGADPIDQRSCLIAPLIAQHELLGYLYADIEGAVGRFDDADRDLLAMLASQAAVALANIRLGEGLERKVDERTAELAVINSIQQGMAGSLDFRGIVELVGDKLRTVFGSDNLSIPGGTSIRRRANALRRAARRARPSGPVRPDPNGRFMRTLFANRPVLVNSRAEMDAWGCVRPKGWRRAWPLLTVPIFCQRQAARRDHARQPRPGAPVQRGRSTLAADGGGDHGHRAGERPAVQRDQGGAGAADRDLGSASASSAVPRATSSPSIGRYSRASPDFASRRSRCCSSLTGSASAPPRRTVRRPNSLIFSGADDPSPVTKRRPGWRRWSGARFT